jgi:glycosyltransferase involved in cell wall biosynthesis
MRIALFADTFLPQVNGVARTLGRLVAFLRARGDAVALVAPRIPGLADERADLLVAPPSIPVPLYPELRLALPISPAAGRRLRAFAPDVVHVATEFTIGWSGVHWAGANGVPLVSSFHTDFPAYLAGYGFAGLERRAWGYLRAFHGHALRTFCPSQATLTQLAEHGFHDRLAIWSRGVDAELFSPVHRSDAVRARLAPGARHVLLYVGRLAPEKRIHVLMDAFEQIRARAPRPVALVLVGGGPEEHELRRRAAPDVYFTGYLEGTDLAAAYAAADVFVFPSDTETFGNVVLEAMASGVPVVAADRGGVTETVRPGTTGELARAGDAGAFAEATLALLHDSERRARMAQEARAAALVRSWTRVLDDLRGAYVEAAATRGRPAARAA